MKSLWVLWGAVFSVNAFGITVKDCPSNLTFKFKDVAVTASVKSVLKEALIEEDDQEAVQEIEVSLNNLKAEKSVNVTLPLVRAESGRCAYYKKGASAKERALLYSTKGRDLVMVQVPIGPRGILARVYGELEVLKQNYVRASAREAGLALAIPRDPYDTYTAGGSLIFVGKAKDLKLQAN